MFENVEIERFCSLSDQERRLLSNCGRAYTDFVNDFVAREHPKALRALLNGIDVAATLNALLCGNAIKQGQNKANFVGLVASETRQVPPVQVVHRMTGKTKQLSLPEMVYEIRCEMVHSYDDLESGKPYVDHHVELRWNLSEYFARPGWTLPVTIELGNKIALNSYALMEQLSCILSKAIFFVEAIQKEQAWKAVSDGSDRRSSDEFPEGFWTIAPAHPDFSQILERAGLVKRIPLTAEQARQMFPSLKVGQRL